MKKRKEHNQFSRYTELTEEGKHRNHELQSSVLSPRRLPTRDQSTEAPTLAGRFAAQRSGHAIFQKCIACGVCELSPSVWVWHLCWCGCGTCASRGQRRMSDTFLSHSLAYSCMMRSFNRLGTHLSARLPGHVSFRDLLPLPLPCGPRAGNGGLCIPTWLFT